MVKKFSDMYNIYKQVCTLIISFVYIFDQWSKQFLPCSSQPRLSSILVHIFVLGEKICHTSLHVQLHVYSVVIWYDSDLQGKLSSCVEFAKSCHCLHSIRNTHQLCVIHSHDWNSNYSWVVQIVSVSLLFLKWHNSPCVILSCLAIGQLMTNEANILYHDCQNQVFHPILSIFLYLLVFCTY